LLLVYAASGLAEGSEEAFAALDKHLAAALKQRLNLNAQALVAVAGEILQAEPALASSDRLVLAIQRRRR